ncbi:ApbE-like lipoprotein [Shewanella sediminis HAW-EB3]|uniref:FAD:protein FMN transferase n=1 Tax=Shewanella sediminis (strain HAW-EB3) TaxID=425104 RepID=A8FR33_SHESH|nr:FAD:protein FMN transferase [Shewanella sediminis]ABV35306.1 ApbE-like lipoprotein [Shewanella sediminis HAW-EB3]
MKLLMMTWLLFLLLMSQAWAHINIEQITGNTMGTSYTVQLRLQDSLVTKQQVKALVEQELERVNSTLSVYREDSEISVFNLNDADSPIPVSERLWDVLQISKSVSAQTYGALDVTLGPVIEFWGFGVKPRDLQHKDRGQLELARSKTGMDGFTLDSGSVTKVIRGLNINPSAVAKGYGVDRVAKVLDGAGVLNYLVEIGGEVRTRGVGVRGREWRVAVTRPQRFSLEIQQLITLKGMSMATSGSYVNFIQSDDRQLSHIIDPVTGMPVESNLVSATVLHRQCAVADGYATAMMILNVEQSIQIANELGLAVMLIEQTDMRLKTHFSDAIYPFLVKLD